MNSHPIHSPQKLKPSTRLQKLYHRILKHVDSTRIQFTSCDSIQCQNIDPVPAEVSPYEVVNSMISDVVACTTCGFSERDADGIVNLQYMQGG